MVENGFRRSDRALLKPTKDAFCISDCTSQLPLCREAVSAARRSAMTVSKERHVAVPGKAHAGTRRTKAAGHHQTCTCACLGSGAIGP